MSLMEKRIETKNEFDVLPMEEKQFKRFLSEVKSLKDPQGATFRLSGVYSNLITVSGTILGRDTDKRIREIGEKYGFHILAKKLTVMFRNPFNNS